MSGSPPKSVETRSLVAGRYQVQALMGEGGMGAVYMALDTLKGSRVALKRLAARGTIPSAGLRFKREFQTLTGLRHPRIVEAYDYGLDDDDPFYTMELLEGGDLRDLAPVDPLRACVVLRDVASALALLHSRRLLHRDISPRNVRITHGGAAKLIDFGVLSTLGATSQEVVGTPPCIAPEALVGAMLDQRADLFALGAIAYWLLTGRHAFPAKNLRDLFARHALSPTPPSRLQSNVPPALDDLVLSLLSIDPLGRPSAAAEVIDRLGAIEGLPPAPDLEVARSYVQSTALAGRHRELAVLRRTVTRAAGGRGRCVVLRGRSGSGKSRLLREMSCEAQLAGAAVAHSAGRTADGTPFALLRDLLVGLHAAAPSEVSAAVLKRPMIARVLPELAALAGSGPSQRIRPDPRGDRTEHRLELQAVLASSIFEIASSRPIALFVDDLQRSDEGSAAVLAVLASEARERPLLIAATTRTDEEWSAPFATRRIHDRALKLRVRNFDAREIESLARGTFGDIPRLAVLADWMLRSCGGGPLECTELLRHLVDRNIIRYVDGMWVIPDALDEEDVPRELHEAMDARIRTLAPEARGLGQVLAVHGGDVPLERCGALTGTRDEDQIRVFAALDDLVREEILVGSADAYRFRHDSLREALLRTLSESERRTIELRVGRMLDADEELPREREAQVGWHLLRGGELQKGAELLEKAGRRLFSTGSFSDAIGPLAAALEVFERDGSAGARCLELRHMLLEAGYNVDRALALKHGEPLVADLAVASGIPLARRLAPWVGAVFALVLALGVVACRRLFTARGERGPNPLEALRMYAASVIYVSGVAAWSNDWATQQRCEKLARPLEVVAPGIGDVIALSLNFNLGRLDTVRLIATRLLASLSSRKWLTEEHKRLLEGAIRHTLAHTATLRVEPSEFLEQLVRLETVDTATWRMGALLLRAEFHLARGEEDLARPYVDAAERQAAKLGAIWHHDSNRYIGPAIAHASAEDVLGLKRDLQALSTYVEAGFGFEAVRDIAQAEYRSLRGEFDEAVRLVNQALRYLPPGEGYLRPWAMAALADIWRRAGDWQRAARAARDGLSLVEDSEHSQTLFRARLVRTLAIVEARLGDPVAATARLDRMLLELDPVDQPLLKGDLCEGRALVALQLNDSDGFDRWKIRVDEIFRSTGNPALIARIDRLNRAWTAARTQAPPRQPEKAEGSTTVRDAGQPSVTPTVADTPLSRVRAE